MIDAKTSKVTTTFLMLMATVLVVAVVSYKSGYRHGQSDTNRAWCEGTKQAGLNLDSICKDVIK